MDKSSDVWLFADLIWLVRFEKIALKQNDWSAYRIDLTDGSESVES